MTGKQTWTPNDLSTGCLDKSRIHTHKINYCRCADVPTADVQLCQMELFPVSFTQPKTAFTFDILDDFLLDNLECGTSAMNYYNKLRMTTSVFPHLVPDRYRELMRVARQWWQLKLLKWNGHGHGSKDRKPGDLALFCPVCPQPGINVILPPEDEREKINSKYELPNPSWLYSRFLVMDGNFKAEHLYVVNPMDEVSLMDSHAFMVSDSTYKSKYNNHRAALKHNASSIRHALTFYDVNCQYHKYLRDRVSDSPFLELDQALEIMPGIGLWHVHGHQDSCYVRYASNFITGAARIDGKIMETLQGPLLKIQASSERSHQEHHHIPKAK
ncbi:hypothetical protein EDB19DRAFT_1896184 [Suillus lakei]|nr:hypothetical protein EDB19DRAFT_1896184 [Suillus lakei]